MVTVSHKNDLTREEESGLEGKRPKKKIRTSHSTSLYSDNSKKRFLIKSLQLLLKI